MSDTPDGKQYRIAKLTDIARIPKQARARLVRDLPALIEQIANSEARGNTVYDVHWTDDDYPLEVRENGVRVL